VFSASTLNNDILVGALGAWCVYFSMRSIYRRSDWVALAVSWLFAGLAVTAKYNGLILVPLVLAATGVLLFRSLRRKLGTRGALRVFVSAAGLVIVLLMVGLWSVRNLETYTSTIVGYPLTLHPAALTGMLVNIFGNLPAELHYSAVTFWGLMAWGTLPLPDWAIALLMGVTGVCFIGVALFVADRSENKHLRLAVLLLVAFVALGWLAVGIKDMAAISPRGRYLLPAFSTVSFLLVLGSKKLLPARFELAGRWLFIASLLVLTSTAPLFLVKPAYATPVLATNADLLPGEQAVYVTFGNFAELLGYRIEPESVQIGDPIEVTLVWRAREQTSNNYVVSMDLLDTNEFLHAGVATHPGHGNYPTSRWRAGDVFRDTYELQWHMLDWEWWPGAATLHVQLYCAGPDLAPTELLDAVDQSGASLGSHLDLGRIKVMQYHDRVIERPVGRTIYRFDNGLALENYWLTQSLPGLGSHMGVGLVWRALEQPPSDYELKIRVVDEQGQQVAGDLQSIPDPEYPVDLWDAGEQVVRMHEFYMPLVLPAGRYRILLSVHAPQTGQPVEVWGAETESAPKSYVELYEFELKEHLTRYRFLPLIRVDSGARYPADIRFANGIRLIAYDVWPDFVDLESNDRRVQLSLFWQADAPSQTIPAGDENATSWNVGAFDVFAHVTDGRAVWQTANRPFFGTQIPDRGDIVTSVHEFVIPQEMPAGKAYFETGLYHYAGPDISTTSSDRLPIVDQTDQAADNMVTLGGVMIGEQTQQDVDPSLPIRATFQDYIELSDLQVRKDAGGSQMEIVLAWRALDRPGQDYTAFVHLIDSEQAIVAQYDQPPGGGDNPTHLWAPNEMVRASFPLQLPPGVEPDGLTLRIGLYDLNTGDRLPILSLVNDQVTAPDGTYLLIPLTVVP
jgi:hypothetical protein